MDKKEVLYRMMLIREMEHKIESLFSEGLLRGTTHCCIGQEAVPVALSYLLDINHDYLCGGHRAHGLSMMVTMKPEMLLGEIMGKPFGMAKGLGGSQHVYYKNYFTNGITGGMATIATGIAFTLKQEKTDAISVVDFGDGAMNEGYVMEAFNLAAEMKLPVLYILENNGYAMSTPVETTNPYIVFEDRVKGFGLPYSRVEATDFDQLYSVLEKAVKSVRETRGPEFVEVITHRFCGHSKSDKREYIPSNRDEYWNEHDCIKSIESQLSQTEVDSVKEAVAKEIERVYQYCVNN
ncbi:MAG: thiamine pyrophosphate-dependent dehydrogenase E1 component subunit alpha [Bacteroidaceae bacterium]|nr:thiamine pyrophosphate-dependent dehydrogenase E1 component subunit alpha [Bacteroidaceae bacterium]